jgi:hypothetical protein
VPALPRLDSSRLALRDSAIFRYEERISRCAAGAPQQRGKIRPNSPAHHSRAGKNVIVRRILLHCKPAFAAQCKRPPLGRKKAWCAKHTTLEIAGGQPAGLPAGLLR